jgi:hypothetical protein
MHDDPGWLDHDQEVVVLVQYLERPTLGADRRRSGSDPDVDGHLVAVRQPLCSARRQAAVDGDTPVFDQPPNRRSRQSTGASEVAENREVEPVAGVAAIGDEAVAVSDR